MEALPGFVSVPRLTGSPRSAGAFFSAVVEARVSPDTWRVRLDGRVQIVTTKLELVPGQTLRLKLASQTGSTWLLQTVGASGADGLRSGGFEAPTALVAAFLSRGLPLAAEKLSAWSRWLVRAPAASDREAWAASLEARGQGPGAPFSAGLDPWLLWQNALERGENPPPPEDDFWDLWNSRNTAGGDPWLAMPLRWTYRGHEDAGLLQAHWSPQAQAIDRWNLTAAPAEVPFRLEAASRLGRLDLTWRFFRDKHRRHFQTVSEALQAGLASSGLTLTLSVAGPPPVESVRQEGIDVEA